MKAYEIRNGTSEDSTVIGRVVASDEHQAVGTLNAYRNGFKVTEPAEEGIVPYAYVEWAHAEIERLSASNVPFWRAKVILDGA